MAQDGRFLHLTSYDTYDLYYIGPVFIYIYIYTVPDPTK